MKITFLGTGTSTGNPQLGCNCPVCTSLDAHDRRLRCSALIENEGTRILIDCGPDFREQMLHQEFGRIDAVLITHEHYDHVGGLDDLRPFCAFGNIPLYAEPYCLDHLFQRMPYCFIDKQYPGIPRFQEHVIKPHVKFQVGNMQIFPIRVYHGKLPIVGFRIGRMAYITDMKTIPEDEIPYLSGIDLLIVNALRHQPHGTHQTIADAIALSNRLNTPETYLIHLSHHAGLHADSASILPPHIHFAYDGQVLQL